MSKILPSSYFANSWFNTDSSTNQQNLFKFGSKNLGKIYKTSFKLFIEYFYMTSNLFQSSKTMAKASELLRSYSNNYKFLTWASINK